MIVYIPVGNGPLRREIISYGHGMIVCRPHFQWPKLDCPWIFDNGAFVDFLRKEEFNEPQFVRCIDKLMKVQPCKRPAWCVTPDIVADKRSLGFSVAWRKDLPNALRWYLAIQDGMEFEHVENALATARFSGLFIGGSTRWKNQRAWEWCLWGHARKLPVHIGRVNGLRRLQWAVNMGADSVDGTGWTRAPHWSVYLRNLPKKQRMLWDGPEDEMGDRGLGFSAAAGA